jgi:hypothetical protein
MFLTPSSSGVTSTTHITEQADAQNVPSGATQIAASSTRIDAPIGVVAREPGAELMTE